MSGWSDIALRARATTVIPRAVMYKAHAVLTRGRSTLEKGHLWIKGESNGVIRYVESPAYNAHAAHLASGWQQDRTRRQVDVLGPTTCRRTWATSRTFGQLLAGVAEHARLGRGRAGDRLLARHLRVDVLPPTRRRRGDDGGRPAPRAATRATRRTCARPSAACYAYDDLAKLNARGATPSPRSRTRRPTTWQWRASSRRPSWSTTTWARHAVDRGLRYRRFINTYAVHRDAWDEHFVIEEQSTVFYKLALEPGYHFDDARLGCGHGVQSCTAKQRARAIGACMRRVREWTTTAA